MHHNILKFLAYNPIKENTSPTKDSKISSIREGIHLLGIKTEYHIPDGRDIGASCGQF